MKDTRDWKINSNRKSLAANRDWKKAFTKCLYRPFDNRHYYHHSDVVELPRSEVMQHMLAGDNLGLICSRQQSQSGTWGLIGVSKNIVECCAISNKTKETNYIFPLYLYPTTEAEKQMGMKRKANFSQAFLNDLNLTAVKRQRF